MLTIVHGIFYGLVYGGSLLSGLLLGDGAVRVLCVVVGLVLLAQLLVRRRLTAAPVARVEVPVAAPVPADRGA